MFPRMSFGENAYCMFWEENFDKTWSLWIMIALGSAEHRFGIRSCLGGWYYKFETELSCENSRRESFSYLLLNCTLCLF